MSDRNNTKDAAYQYDPLDRLTNTHSTQRFYNGTRIATEIQEERKTSFFENGSIPLAELHPEEAAILLATDVQASVLHRTRPALNQTMTYGPYGHHPTADHLHGAQGFNGQLPDEITGHYLLGQGYRAFNPVLMRFNSPDNKSPFSIGGLNAYAYCSGDPVNRQDPSGHFSLASIGMVLMAANKFKRLRRSTLMLTKQASTPKVGIQGKVLTNHYKTLLSEERKLLNSSYLSKGQEPRKIIKTSSDLYANNVGRQQKFVLNKSGQMAVALTESKTSNNYISHPTIADVLGEKQVISAGTLWMGSMGEVVVTNRSGHYRPSVQDLAPAVEFLRKMGFEPDVMSFN
jgi:RHS repeat-associated protein